MIREAGAISYGELRGRALHFAAHLDTRDDPHSRIGLLLPNLDLFPETLYGIWAAGRTAVLLNPISSPREIEEAASVTGISRTVTVAELESLVPRGIERLLVDPDRGGAGDGAGKDRGGDARTPAAGAGANPTRETPSHAAILFTAADHGWARAAPLSHANLLANQASTVEAMGLTPEDRVAAILPLIHAFGLTVTLNGALAAGAAVIPVPRYHPIRLLRLLEEKEPTVIAGVPSIYIGLLAAARREERVRHHLRVAICGGAPLPREVAERWQEVFGIPLRQGYGLTEAGPVCLFNRVDQPNRMGTIGTVFPGVEASVRGPDGAPIAPDEVGELWVRGPNVFEGYLGESGCSPVDGEGWLRTGDLVSRDEEGFFRFRGMIKPMYTHNGFNVYPREIERVVSADPRVATARVFARPDAQRENETILEVRPAPGFALAEEDVRELCHARLAQYKQPREIRVA